MVEIQKNDYECHVTLDPKYKGPTVEAIASNYQFKTSLLVGDEELGPDKHLYITSHDYTYDRMKARMDDLVSHLNNIGIKIKRKKIEHILLDERF